MIRIVNKKRNKLTFFNLSNAFKLALILNVAVSYYINFISNNNNLALFISDALKVSSLIIAVKHLYLTQKDYQTSNQHLEKKEAVEMARYYEEIIMPLMSKITSNYEHQSLIELNKPFSYKIIRSFNLDECENILDKNDISLEEYKRRYMEIIERPSFYKSYAQEIYKSDPSGINKRNLDIIMLYDLYTKQKQGQDESDKNFNVKFEELYEKQAQKIIFKKSKTIKVEDVDKEDIKEISREVYLNLLDIANKEMHETKLRLADSYHDNINDILNKLEFFSMSFNSGIADEGIVYQSLHQTFRRTIENLYYFIALQNKDSKNKYYTHITELYNLWNNRYLNTEKDEENIRKEQMQKEQNLTFSYNKKERA